jgi:hypothetical protein
MALVEEMFKCVGIIALNYKQLTTSKNNAEDKGYLLTF